MKCITCSHLNLKDHPKHAAIGFGKCKAKNLPGQFTSIAFEHQCELYKEAPAEIIAARLEWEGKQK